MSQLFVDVLKPWDSDPRVWNRTLLHYFYTSGLWNQFIRFYNEQQEPHTQDSLPDWLWASLFSPEQRKLHLKRRPMEGWNNRPAVQHFNEHVFENVNNGCCDKPELIFCLLDTLKQELQLRNFSHCSSDVITLFRSQFPYTNAGPFVLFSTFPLQIDQDPSPIIILKSSFSLWAHPRSCGCYKNVHALIASICDELKTLVDPKRFQSIKQIFLQNNPTAGPLPLPLVSLVMEYLFFTSVNLERRVANSRCNKPLKRKHSQ